MVVGLYYLFSCLTCGTYGVSAMSIGVTLQCWHLCANVPLVCELETSTEVCPSTSVRPCRGAGRGRSLPCVGIGKKTEGATAIELGWRKGGGRRELDLFCTSDGPWIGYNDCLVAVAITTALVNCI